MIFMLHINFFGDSEAIRFPFELLTRWAVPFFFIVSSFFLFSKEDPISNNINKQTLINYIKRIASLYAAWFIVNLPSIVYLRLLRPGIGQFDTWVAFLKGVVLSSSFAGSWYLLSCIFSAFLLFVISKKINTRKCIFISIFPFVLCLLTSTYGGILPASITGVLRWFLFPLNIFGGLLYFSLGKYLYENKVQLLKHSSFLYIGIALLLGVLYIIEIKTMINAKVYWSSDYAISLLPLAFIISILSLKAQVRIHNPIAWRKISTIVYCSQGNILCAVSATKYIGINSFIYKGLIGLLLMSVLIGMIFYLQRDKKIRCVNYLT